MTRVLSIFGTRPEAVKMAPVVWQLARTGLPFTTDDVWLLLLGKGVAMPPEARALGAIMQAAARGGYIRKTGDYRESERAVCHRNPKAVWQGTKRAVW